MSNKTSEVKTVNIIDRDTCGGVTLDTGASYASECFTNAEIGDT